MDFARGHVPGALSLAWEPWCGAPPPGAAPILSEPGYWGTLADASPSWYAERLGQHGIASDLPIVVYADGVRSKGREGRVAWMLLYLGARSVALLDGGWAAWCAQGGPIADQHTPVVPARFCVAIQPERRWTQERLEMAYRAGRVPLLVDTRTPAEFAGECYDYLPRRGRLPGAILLPFDALFVDRHYYLDRQAYLAQLPTALHPDVGRADFASPRPGERLVAYCEVGVRASLAALLHEVHTGEVVGVFDGSLIEWALHADLPIA